MCNSRLKIALEFLNHEIQWYDDESILYKKWYTCLVVVDIIISALIPFTTIFITNFPFTQYIVALMGSIVTIISGFLATFQFHEKWIEYRITAENLKHHRSLFNIGVYPYNSDDKIDLLIKNIIAIIHKENTNWVSNEKNKKPITKEQ